MGIVFFLLALIALGVGGFGFWQYQRERRPLGRKLAVAGTAAGALCLLFGGHLVLLLLLLGAVLIFGVYHHRKHHAEWGRQLALVCFAAILICGLIRVVLGMSGCRGRGELRGRDAALRTFAETQGSYIGNYVAEQWPGQRVLIITDVKDGLQGESIAALEHALRDRDVDYVGTETIGIYDPTMLEADPEDIADAGIEMARYAKEPFSQKMLAQLLRANPADVVVTYAGLPMDTMARAVRRDADDEWEVEDLPYGPLWQWPKEKLPHFVVVENTRYVWPETIEHGYVDAIVLGNPGYQQPEPGRRVRVPGNVETAFALRYVLVDEGNVGAHAERLPRR